MVQEVEEAHLYEEDEVVAEVLREEEVALVLEEEAVTAVVDSRGVEAVVSALGEVEEAREVVGSVVDVVDRYCDPVDFTAFLAKCVGSTAAVNGCYLVVNTK